MDSGIFFYLLTTVNSATVNVNVQLHVWVLAFNSFRHVPRLLSNFTSCLVNWVAWHILPLLLAKTYAVVSLRF